MQRLTRWAISTLLVCLVPQAWAASPPAEFIHSLPPELQEQLKAAEQSETHRNKAHHDPAYQALLEEMLPMSPDQIRKLNKLYDVTQQAAAAPANTPPTPVSSSLAVSLAPGSESPIVRLSAGFVSSLVFLDSTGAPWPLQAYSIGDPDTFNIQWDQSSHQMFIQSLKPYAHGNLAVRLHDSDTPVMISLVSGQRTVDYRVDLQVSGRGPNALAPLVHDLSQGNQSMLMQILDGLPPQGATKLHIPHQHGEVWQIDKTLFFRTPLTLLSPAWRASISSADGTHVYEMMTTPVILATENGHPIHIRLEGL